MSLTHAEINQLTGLSTEEAQELLKKHGYNELPSGKKRSIFKIIFEVLREPMILLLIACAVLYFFLGDFKEALMLVASVGVVSIITIVQENRTERTLEALRDLSSPRALVIRDGAQKRIAGREVVPGDLLVIKEGDRVAADAVLLWGLNVVTDESFLTGESVPVRKISSEKEFAEVSRPGGDDLPFIYSGSLLVEGQGIAKVLATGGKTEIGKIGKSLQKIEEERTFLQKEIKKIVGWFFVLAVISCLVVVLGYGLVRHNWLAGALSGIALAMSVLPEEFPIILTIFLAMGAWRMSQKKVLARRIAAVEILGSATVLCVDKTGTLTQNQMSVKKIFSQNVFLEINNTTKELPENFHQLIEYGILASKRDPFDPMEKALQNLGHASLNNTEHLHSDWSFFQEYPLSKNLLSLTHVWETTDKEGYIVSAKGAPEAIMDLCHLSAKEQKELEEKIKTLASEGLRVIGVAKSTFTKKALPKSQHDFDFQFLGLIGLADPVRETVPAAIKECYTAGIRVIMITGDYPITAKNIAEQIGLKNADQIITGAELVEMSPEELKKKIKTINVFARMVPEQKLAIVDALKANGEIVAMTGDGVNDAPALKAAHIGVAMGQRGTDVAREAADLVLLEDDFSSIVSAVRLGRRIFDNIRKAMAYVIAMHPPIAGLAFIPIIFNWPMILYPVHIVFLELIIDPACSIIFEAEKEEKNIMKRQPRNPEEPLFKNTMFLLSFMQGIVSFILVALVFKLSLGWGASADEARTLTFASLIISNLCLILTNRSWQRSIWHSLKTPNQAMLWVFGGTFIFLALIVYWPPLQSIFHLSLMHPSDIIVSFIAGFGSIVWFEITKLILRRKKIELLR